MRCQSHMICVDTYIYIYILSHVYVCVFFVHSEKYFKHDIIVRVGYPNVVFTAIICQCQWHLMAQNRD